MAGTTNFQQFNPGAANQETDAQYTADSQRSGGTINGQIFNDKLANKLFYQLSTWITAQANSMANKGYSPMDTDVNTLEGVLANIVTFADLKPNMVTVPFSSNPVFDASSSNGFRIDLAGNVTSSTLTGSTVGQIVTFYIVSGNPGNYTFAWPSNVVNPPNVQTQSTGNLMTYQFISDGSNLYPLSTFINFLQSEISALQTSVAGKQANLGFTPVQQGGGAGQGTNKLYIGWGTSRLKAQVDSTDLGQFVFDSNFSGSLVTNGWTKLPNGLILQWCQGTPLSGTQNGVVFSTNFPIGFPSACLFSSVSPLATGSDYGEMPVTVVTSWSSTGVSYYYQRNADHGGMTITPLIFAIGY